MKGVQIMDETPHASMKQCSKCEQFFPATNTFFTKHPQKKDGLNPSCKACKNGKPFVEKDPVPEGMKQCTKCKQIYLATNSYFSLDRSKKDGLVSICKVCINAYSKNYNDAHIEEHREYRQAHKEEIKERNKQGYQEHKEDIRAAQKTYRDTYKATLNASRRQLRQENEVARLRMQEIARRSYSRRKAEINARRRAFWSTNRDEINALRRQSYHLYKEGRSVYHKGYRQSHADSISEQKKRWYDTQKETIPFQEKRKAYMISYYKTEHGKMASRAKNHRRRALKMSAKGTYTAQDVTNQMKRQHGKCYYCQVKFSKGKRAYHVDHIVPLTREGSNDPSNLVLACVSCNSSKHNKLLHEWSRGGRLL